MVTQTPDGKLLFQFFRPDARQVSIAGDFNGWQNSFHMTRGLDGWWRSQVELAPGTYRFRYLADDQWFTDYAAFGIEPGPYGWNSVLLVQPAEKLPPAPIVPVLEAEEVDSMVAAFEPDSAEAVPARPVRQKPRQSEPAGLHRRRRPALAN